MTQTCKICGEEFKTAYGLVKHAVKKHQSDYKKWKSEQTEEKLAEGRALMERLKGGGS